MTFDWEKIIESKRAMRRKLAALPIAEKLRMLDALRERQLQIRGRVPRPGHPLTLDSLRMPPAPKGDDAGTEQTPRSD